MFRQLILYAATGLCEIVAVLLVMRWTTGRADSSVLVPAGAALAVFFLLLQLHAARQRAYTVYAGLCLAAVMLFLLFVDHVDPREAPTLIWKSGTHQ